MLSTKMKLKLCYYMALRAVVVFGWHSLYAAFHRDAMVIIALAFPMDQLAVVQLINRFNGEYSITFCTILTKYFKTWQINVTISCFST